jgi:membrane protease YdiL (CAAX protease family)
MVFTAIAVSGLSRRDMFLTVGDMAAPSGLRWRDRELRWTILGPIVLPLITGVLIVQLLFTVGPNPALAEKAVAALPLALIFAVINPIAEEVRYRCILFAQGVPLFGSVQLLAMTTVVFAFGHWFGHPSGPTGVVLAALAGATWGWSILSTRGIGWAWIIHGVQDLVILLAIAAAP